MCLEAKSESLSIVNSLKNMMSTQTATRQPGRHSKLVIKTQVRVQKRIGKEKGGLRRKAGQTSSKKGRRVIEQNSEPYEYQWVNREGGQPQRQYYGMQTALL